MSLLALSQMLLVAVPAIGTVLIIVAVMAIPLAPVAASLSPRTRSVAGRVAFATSCALVLVWLAQGSTTSATPAPSEPEKAMATTRAVISSMQSLSADVEGVVGADRFTGTVHLKRPNFAKIEIRGSEGLGRFQVVSNGRELFVYFPGDNQYSRMPPGHDGRNITAFVVAQVQYFFNPSRLGQMAPGGAVRLEADETFEGESYRVVRATTAPARSTRYYISRRDGLVHRVAYDGSSDRQDFVQLRNVRGNAELAAAFFAWSLPAGAATLQMPVSLDTGGAGIPR
jgi:outer membrane lipoprotein-sorting protein